ncbi:hypothetical protein F4777DRAFT_554436 [Nemania sp. FL0916]|nr:hypothetical protein F4777DRAFT_554436 [Nemania sp. FL0916]
MDTSSDVMDPAAAKRLENSALSEMAVRPEPEMLEDVKLAEMENFNTETAEDNSTSMSTADKVPALSMPSVAATIDAVEEEDTEASSEDQELSHGGPAKHTRSIILRHSGDGSFILPLDLCRTWKSMEDLIRASYGNNKEATQEIDEGKYELFTTARDKILPQFWEMLVEPGWEITVRRRSQKDESPDTADGLNKQNNKSRALYTTKLKYTVEFRVKEHPESRISQLMYSKSYDEPVVLEKKGSDGLEVPILEEITSVTMQERRSWRIPSKPPQGRPKLNDGDEIGQTFLRIHSPFLLNALRSIIKYSSEEPSGGSAGETGDEIFPHPYQDLFHYKRELSDYKKDTTGPRANHTPEYNAECDRHIDFLLKYLDEERHVRVQSTEAKWAQKIPATTFAGIWLLLKPGTDVYVEEHGQLNAYVVESVFGGVDYQSTNESLAGAKNYSIWVWNLKYDGKVLKRQLKNIHVPVFDNDRDLFSLPLFPTRFRDEKDCGARRKQLIERGRKAFRFAQGPTYLEYTGLGMKPGSKQYTRARVVVQHDAEDMKDYDAEELEERYSDDGDPMEHGKRYFGSGYPKAKRTIGDRARAPRCRCNDCERIYAVTEKYIPTTFSDYDNIDPKKVEGLSEHQYMLCMSHMDAFILKDREYDLLDVSGLVDVDIVENAIDRLVMRPETNKDTIKAIVKTYADSGQGGHFNADFIRGKGEGQIFLLHGPPGTGKTLTAESVAEYTKRPLLSITAADLGHEPVTVEKNLLGFFQDAKDWDAIVLLDEADVYLERRSAHDLKRNSIVSIFLRAMDYFQGILFLTTNRVGHFDEAFMSRIHVSIGYQRLDEEARGKIWDNLFAKLKEDHKNGGPQILYEYDAKQYVKKDLEIRKLEWNGREIRNAFQTAVALAVFDSKAARAKGARDEDSIPEIKEKHLSQVVSMSAAFKEYITATHEGIDDADMAYKIGIRQDRMKKPIGGV